MLFKNVFLIRQRYTHIFLYHVSTFQKPLFEFSDTCEDVFIVLYYEKKCDKIQFALMLDTLQGSIY